MISNPAQGVTWDLSDLYTSPTDPQIASDLDLAASKAAEFETTYKPFFEKKAQNAALPLAKLLKDYKAVATLATQLGVFAQLSFAENTLDSERGAFLQKIRTRLTDIQSHMLFFEVHWNKLSQAQVTQLLKDPSVQADRHFLEKIRQSAPHTLAEGEEKIMAVKSNTGGHAFSRLFDETINNLPFYIEVSGRRVKKTESEMLALLHSADRAERKRASDSLAEGLAPNTRLLTYLFNMTLADHHADLKIRHYRHPMDPMNLANEIDLESVLRLVESVKRAYPIAQRYYRLKKRLLKLDTLYDYDRYAPVNAANSFVSFDECKRIVLAGYFDFCEEAGKIVEQFFAKRWIDAELREGKQGGGFCCAVTPDLHPYILVNYTGTPRDVMTVAHELGHGLHQFLARKVGIFESDAPLTLAETASVFGEMLIFEKLLRTEEDPHKRLGLLCGKIDDHFATVFRQIAMTDFELQAHEAAIKEGELTHEILSDLWMRSNAVYYADSVKLTDNYRHGWKMIPHFIHSPFYCYAYAFAQLFVLSLFQEYKKDETSFVPTYLEMLSLGGSKKPAEIAALAGLDIHQPDFWSSGIALLEALVKEAEQTA